MEFYHHHVSLVRRSEGQNAIASAAYISGLCLQKLDGSHADYRQKKGVCGHKIILPSQYAHISAPTAQELWKLAESTDNRKNSITARRADLALPKDFTMDESLEVGYKYAQDLTDRYDVVTQIDFHDLTTNNPHIDMQFTTRVFDGEKLTKKTRILDEKKTGVDEIKWMREQFAKRINEVLIKYDKQVDHRSYKEQGLEKVPQKHLGRKCTAMKRKGIQTDMSKYNDKVREHNKLIEERILLNKEISSLQEQLKENNYDILEQEETNRICGSNREHADLGAKTHQLGGEGEQTPATIARSRNYGNQDHFQQEPRTTGDTTKLLYDLDGANQGKQETNSTVGQLGGITQCIERTTETKSRNLQNYPSNKENIGGILNGDSQCKEGLSKFQQHIQSLYEFTIGYSETPTGTSEKARRSYRRNQQDYYRYIQSIEQFIKWGSKAASRNSRYGDTTTSALLYSKPRI